MQQQFPNQQEFYSDFDFTNAKLLGQGTFGKVYKAESKGITSLAKGQYAIKIIETHSEQAYSLALCELNLNQIIHYHTNVITIYKVYSWMEHGTLQKYMFAIVMELGLNSLKSELDNRREMKRIYEDALIIDIMNQCLTTFDYLARDKSLYHRDIKPENILITNYKPFTVKIADFGAGKETLTENAMMNTLVGTPLFLSPKLWVAFQQNATGKVKHHLEKSDVFSLGLTFLQTILLLTDRELMKLNDPIIYETNGDAIDCSDNDMLLSKCPGWNKLQAHIKSIQNPIIGSCIYGMTHFSEKKRFTWLQALKALNTDYQDPLQQDFISLEQTMNQNQQQFEVSKPLKTYKNEQIQLRYHGANLNLPKSNYFLSAGTQIVAWNNEGLKIIGITGTSQTLYDSQVLHVAYLQQLQILVGINSYGEIFAINIRDKKVVSEKIPNSQFNPQQITVMKHMRKDMVLLGTTKGELIVLAFDQSTPQVVQKFKDHDQPIQDLIYDDQFKQVICYHQDQLIVLTILVQQSSTKIKTETPLSGLKLLSDEYFAGSSKTEPSIYIYHVFEGTITLAANINTHSFIPQSFICIGNYLVWNSDQVICALNYLSKIKQEQSLDLYVKLEHSNQQLIVCDGYLIIGCNSTEIHKYSVGKPVKSKEACACQLQ